MAALQERRARLLASLYAKFGEAATWTPVDGGAAVPVTVRRVEGDELVEFGQTQVPAESVMLKVRVSALADAYEGDRVALIDTGETFRIVGDPRRVRFGLEWMCEAVAT